MKVPFKSAFLLVGAMVAGLAAPLFVFSANAAPGKPDSGRLPDLDSRVVVQPAPDVLLQRESAVSRLKGRMSSVVVDFDPLTGTPSFIHSRSGFLTGPNGQGGTVSAQAGKALNTDPYAPVKAFLNEHSSLFGHGAEALDNASVSRDSVGAHNGLRTVVWQQQLDGIPVFEANLIGNVTKNGELVMLASRFLAQPAQLADAGNPNRSTIETQPPVDAKQAIVKAAQNIGDTLTTEGITDAGTIAGDGYHRFQVGTWASYARLVWLPMNQTSMRLAWEVYVTSQVTRYGFELVIDAETGDVLLRRTLTKNISDATYNVYTSDSPSPFSPGWPTPNVNQPPLTNRVMVTLSALDVTASPNGWINDGDNETQGNNTDTFLDRDFDGQPDNGTRPQGNPNRVFDFPLDLTLAPDKYENAATVQMFYWVNYYHDRLYQLGFTESAGNYQNNNFGRGGAGNDRIIAWVQAGADVGAADNAFFTPAPDGINGHIAMFVWDGTNPNRDGDLDTDIIFHEATHGTSERLVGAGVGISALQPSGMGEGWSDFISLCLASEAADDPDGVYAHGAYSTRGVFTQQNYYFGFRHYPYSTDMAKNPFTFKDIDPTQVSPHAGVPLSPGYPFNSQEAPEVHHQGEIWCTILWDVRANLIHKYGYSGNQLMMQLVIDGMKLAPANPTFVEARDAIIAADLVNNSGANSAELWKGFAKRGLGISAVAPPNNTTTGVIEAFDTPGLQIESLTISGGNGNGVIDFNECNDVQIVLRNTIGQLATGVSVRLNSTNAGVSFGSKFSSYADIPVSATGTNLGPLTLSTSPTFVCGTPVTIQVLVKSDQLTRTNYLTLSSGTILSPLRYDSAGPVAIPDGNTTGTNSIIVVSNISSVVTKVGVSLYIPHTFDSDLSLQLIAPDGTVVSLSRGNGGGGNNYGVGCSPDTFRTTFDDSATTPIGSANPPFAGTFKPESPLSVLAGKSGTNINGIWKLHVVDSVAFDVGSIQCWSLFLYPPSCTDGGGTCPGADLSIGMKPLPDPVFIGSNLVYAITVTNIGPSPAKNTVVDQSLPTSMVPVSAFASQGSCSFAGNTMVGNLGTVGIGSVVTINVTVTPAIAGTYSSTAAVHSSEAEPDNSNNSATVVSHVNPASAELAIGILDTPDPVLLGAQVTYTVSVTNRGPSTASGVTVTNTLSAGLVVQNAVASQGSVVINGNVVSANLLSIPNGGHATVTITATPVAEGSVSVSSEVRGLQADPLPANNTAVATTIVGPAANLGLSLVDTPDPVVVRSNWTYFLIASNTGPSVASSVVINQTLPANVTVVSTNTTQGTLSVGGGTITANIGSLSAGASATVTVVVNATNSGVYGTSANVTAAQADPDASNNSASATTTVAPPNVTIAAAGATLTAESFTPANGALDVGETVTMQLRLRNAGNVQNTNLTATLLASGGVTSPNPSTPVTYGMLPPGGLPVAKPFTFTVAGTNGGTVTVTLQLQDGVNNLGTVNYTFGLPTVKTFANTNRISITDDQPLPWPAGPANPYPSTNLVSGVVGLVGKVTLTLSNLTHSFPDDIDLLLEGPGGQKAILMSDAGGSTALNNVNVTLDDGAPSQLPDTGQILSTSYRPADYETGDSFNSPAPAGPYATTLSAFAGLNPNGTWKLYIMDDTTGDAGSVSNGWSLAVTIVNPINQLADLGLTAVAVPGPALVAGNITCTYTITNAGPNTATGVAFTNVVPGTALLLGASASQGVVTTNGNTVTVSLGNINVGAMATVTVVVKPTSSGVLSSPGNVASSETDLNPANNAASATATVNVPNADLAISQTLSNGLGGNVVLVMTVNNNGPQPALNVVVTDPLPAGLSYVSSSAPNTTNNAGTITIGLGDLSAGSASTFTLTVSGTGTKTNTASVATSSTDGNSANNTATVVIAPNIVAAGAMLTGESGPVNGAVDAGETVTVTLNLQNVGTTDPGELVATLQASGGVTPLTPSQSYGALAHGGAAAGQSFSFTASGPNGGVVVATLQLTDGAVNLGSVPFAFHLPTSVTYSNSTPIVIPDHGGASPYPSSIDVNGLTGLVSSASVTLYGFTHGFPDDVDVLLVSPAGQKLVLMSDAGGGHAVTNLILNFVDAGAQLPDTTTLSSGTFAPTDYEEGDPFPAPAPAGPLGSSFSTFNGGNPNGTWSLYVMDDATGDGGIIGSGWSLSLTTLNTVNPVADLSVTMTAAPNPALIGNGITFTILVTNRGPVAASGVLVSDVLPSGLTLAQATTTQGSVTNSGNNVTGVLGSLANGAGAVMTIRASASEIGGVINSATVSGNETDLNSANNSATASISVTAPVVAILSDGAVTNGQVQFTLTGQVNTFYVIQSSTDLTSWSPLVTNTTGGVGLFKFVDSVPGNAQRFYRAVRVLE